MIEENEKTKAIKDFALKQLFAAIAQIGETAIDAQENGLTAGHIKTMRNMVSLVEKIIDVAQSADYNEMLHCLLVGIPKKRTQEAEPETNQEPQQSEPEPTDQEEPIQDEPVPEELVQEEQKETQQQ